MGLHPSSGHSCFQTRQTEARSAARVAAEPAAETSELAALTSELAAELAEPAAELAAAELAEHAS